MMAVEEEDLPGSRHGMFLDRDAGAEDAGRFVPHAVVQPVKEPETDSARSVKPPYGIQQRDELRPSIEMFAVDANPTHALEKGVEQAGNPGQRAFRINLVPIQEHEPFGIGLFDHLIPVTADPAGIQRLFPDQLDLVGLDRRDLLEGPVRRAGVINEDAFGQGQNGKQSSPDEILLVTHPAMNCKTRLQSPHGTEINREIVSHGLE